MLSGGVTAIDVWSAEYPARLLDRLGDAAPDTLHFRGDIAILSSPFLAWFASARIPPDLVLPALDRAVAARERGEVVASGFHSSVEREWMNLLLGGDAPVIVCPARGIERFRVGRGWDEALKAGRLLLVSAHPAHVTRPTARSAAARNRVIAALAERVFVVAATPGGRLHALAREVLVRGQRLACFDHPVNEDLLLMGADPVAHARSVATAGSLVHAR